MSEAHPPSPCVKICMLDPTESYCVGCWRSTREIAEWSSLDREAKRAVLLLTEHRKARRREEMRAMRKQRAAASRKGRAGDSDKGRAGASHQGRARARRGD